MDRWIQWTDGFGFKHILFHILFHNFTIKHLNIYNICTFKGSERKLKAY